MSGPTRNLPKSRILSCPLSRFHAGLDGFRESNTHLLSLIYSNPQECSEQEFHRSARFPWMNLIGSAVSPTGREQRQEDPMGDPRPAVANNRIEFLSSFILISAETIPEASKQHGSRNDRHAEPPSCLLFPAHPTTAIFTRSIGPLEACRK